MHPPWISSIIPCIDIHELDYKSLSLIKHASLSPIKLLQIQIAHLFFAMIPWNTDHNQLNYNYQYSSMKHFIHVIAELVDTHA